MNQWRTDFQVRGEFASLPQMLRVGWASVTLASNYGFTAETRRGFPYCTFQFTLEGAGVYADDSGTYDVGPGHGFLFTSESSDWSYRYPPGGTAPWTFVYAEFTGGNTLVLSQELVARHGPIYALSPDSLIIRTLLGFHNSGWKTIAHGAAANAELCLELILKMAECAGQPQQGDSRGPLIETALSLIENRLDRPLGVEELAAALAISREHFTRIFRRDMGLSPHQYIVQQKIRLACHLLRTTSLPCKEIAECVGDNSPAHFSKQFRQLAGVSPKAFRDQKIVHPLF